MKWLELWQRFKARICTRDRFDVDDRMQDTMPIPSDFPRISQDTHKWMLDQVPDTTAPAKLHCPTTKPTKPTLRGALEPKP